ncbi:hypothetical protein N7454_008400 [Penicillium verhagenii]|nr:hypothetical protein N7454_008400 [Penicillium verhagenii]
MPENCDVELPRTPKRGNKSFNGCWTCRKRSIRCDEAKPHCSRCVVANRECEGFDIRLTWLTITPDQLCQRQATSQWGSRDLFARRDNDGDENVPSQSKRRHIPSRTMFNISLPSYNEVQLDMVLHDVETKSENHNYAHLLQQGPFGVFRLKPQTAADPHANLPSVATPMSAASTPAPRHGDGVFDFTNTGADKNWTLHDTASNASDHLSPLPHPSSGFGDTSYLTPTQTAISWNFPLALSNQKDVDSSLKLPELVHHWKRYLSRLMIPFATENPYNTIITPMMDSVDPDQMTPANSAVFWSIVTASAFSKARMVQDGEEYTKLGEAYYAKTLNLLSLCFSTQEAHQSTAVLAAITMSSLMDVFRPLPDSRESWQMHLQAGRLWIGSQELELPCQDPDASILIELILLLEVLGFSGKGKTTPSVHDSFLSLKYSTIDRFKLKVLVLHDSYQLERLFGLPLNVFECIIWTNLLVQQGSEASQEHIDALGFQITSSNPAFFHHYSSEAPDAYTRRCVRYLFYYASEIYFERRVLHTPVADVQWIVTAAFPYIQGILSHDHELQGPCISWPIFIIGAEAMDAEVCKTTIASFDLDWPRKIGNYSAAKEVLLEVQRRQNEHLLDNSFHWTHVMDELGIDVLLV